MLATSFWKTRVKIFLLINSFCPIIYFSSDFIFLLRNEDLCRNAAWIPVIEPCRALHFLRSSTSGKKFDTSTMMWLNNFFSQDFFASSTWMQASLQFGKTLSSQHYENFRGKFLSSDLCWIYGLHSGIAWSAKIN